jgi:kinesin family protein 3/17
MIANVGPSEYNYNETLTTLRYAQRAKTIQNKPVLNEDPQDTKLREYQEEIARLRQLITERQTREQLPKTRKKRAILKPEKARKLSSTDSEKSDSEEEPTAEDDIDASKELIALDEETNEALEREREITSQLANKLNELEGQLVRGGKNILDTYTERQIELEKKMSEIAERKVSSIFLFLGPEFIRLKSR